ncbi:protein GRIP [Tripterygium wilfordii]|uniref:Protein GRIP n=1 Tax=Tripterygium wilfordii TaxID=458696 RepID=A0A7J7CP80_TRIWF|nr:protein GRIP [Tripterygium wilfordii]KAF5735895.1 protein GRIP [Tripterygium wilfordii]
MSTEIVDVSEMPDGNAEEPLKSENLLFQMNHGSNGNLAKENGFTDSRLLSEETHEQLLQTVMELKFQNEFFKSQFAGFKDSQLESGGSQLQIKVAHENSESAEVRELHEIIECLRKELHEEKLTRGAAEEALRHLREAYSEADAKAQDLSTKLAEAKQKLDQEIKEREEKYVELDSKFQRLHKRAKQRIQEIQKEKDDLEAKFRDVSETADRTSSQQLTLQQELERTRQQANEALKAMDAERQQLRSANNKLRDSIEELRRSLRPKEQELELLQQTILEKEQMLEDMRGLLQSADEKRLASLFELSAKHQKNIDNLEAQLADALADRNKATETISSLQVLVAEKESKIAEVEAGSSGEAARLRVAVEAVKGELAHIKHEHEKEKDSWEAASQALKAKLEIAESNCIRAEIEAAKMRSQLELEVSVKAQVLNTRDAELLAAKEEIKHLESEFSSYKVRAHALLQKKDAELAAAKDSEQVKALEDALREAEKELEFASAEKDKTLQDLGEALSNCEKELAERDVALDIANERIKSTETKLYSLGTQHELEKEAWEMNLQNVEELWRFRCEALKAESEASSGQELQREIEELRLQYKRLKEEDDSFRDLADRMIEEKDKEISRLLDDNKSLQLSLQSRPLADQNNNFESVSGMQKQDVENFTASAADQQILLLARQQAQREEELVQSQRHILALQEEIEELEHENRLHSQQEAMLKAELRNTERMQKREGVDMTYLKNVILKLLETGEVEALLPVIAMLLQFSPEEMQKCQQAYRALADVPPSPASNASGSLFSRFSFS